ncbi:unnamed protein product [Phaeothamnion confervicola]
MEFARDGLLCLFRDRSSLSISSTAILPKAARSVAGCARLAGRSVFHICPANTSQRAFQMAGPLQVPRTHRIPSTPEGRPVPVGWTTVSTLKKYIDTLVRSASIPSGWVWELLLGQDVPIQR